MLLAHDGIFPVTKDKNGHPIPSAPASGFDIPGTIQGEGKLSGVPSLFVRLAGCNLHCCWQAANGKPSPCDTTYAAYKLQGAHSMTIEDIYQTLLHNTPPIRHIVITGGEPLLQAAELSILCYKLKDAGFHLTLETNATLYDKEVAQYIDLFSLSPKLVSSHFKASSAVQRLCPEKIQAFIDDTQETEKDFQLKFVYSCENDITEIRELLRQLHGWKSEDILLMPLGGNPEILRINIQKTLEQCLRNGWRYCDRLHISLFGDKAGV